MSPKLEKFVDPLQIMKTLNPKETGLSGTYYEVRMQEFQQKLHRDLPPTRLWGYNSQFPGPTIEAKQGEVVKVKWKNNLPDKHFLPVDKTFHHLEHMPEVRTVTHLHGSETRPDSDGYPDAWFTNNFKEVGEAFTRKVYEYPNNQRGATLWYHDHAMGITRLNVYAGLAGMYIIRDEQEKSLKLPSGSFEIPLLIQDRTFNDDGSLFYPSQPDNPTEDLPNPSIRPFFIGDTILVNGKVWPFLEVEPRKYRFRILNGSNTRGYQMELDSGQSFYQIGSDGGLLPKTVMMDSILIEPAERMDVIVDFSQYEGKTITLKNNLGPNADPADQTGDILQFRVNQPLSSQDNSHIPNRLSYVPSLKHNNISAIRNLKLVSTTDQYNRTLLLLDNKMWMDPVTEKPRLDTTEIWSLMNLTNVTHPIHIHLIQFQILDRRPFDLDRYNEDRTIIFTGPAQPPKPNEYGWKDTVAVPPGEITRLIMRFSPYSGSYVWHCHVLEHEDYDMMRPYMIIDPHKED